MNIIVICVAIMALDVIYSQRIEHEDELGSVKVNRQIIGAPLILGGTEAERNSHSYQISLRQRVGGRIFHFCGGTLVEVDKIATAAHCLSDKLNIIDDIFVVAGDHHLFEDDKTEQIRDVRSISIEPRYNLINGDFDVAIIRTSRPFILNNGVSLIQLSAVEPMDGDCIVTGWGNTISDGGVRIEALLQQVTISIVPRSACKIHWPWLTDRMICAGGHVRDSCLADGGGPLVCANMLAGIVSFGTVTCAEGVPAVYANVVSILDFINNQ